MRWPTPRANESGGHSSEGYRPTLKQAVLSEASSQVSEDLTSALNAPDGNADGKSSSMSGAEQSSLDIGPTSPDGTTRRRFLPTPTAADASEWMSNPGRFRGTTRREDGSRPIYDDNLAARIGRLTSSLEDSPASLSPSPVSAEVRTTSDGSGPSSLGSFAYYDPASSSWRTFQVSLLEEWATFSETWPRAGTTRSGTASRRQPSVPLTSVTGSSSWHTPTATDRDGRPRWDKRASPGYVRNKPVPNLMAQILERDMWPTPTESDGLGGPGSSGRDGGLNLRTEIGGQLNPTFVEWLMGFPKGWTEV